MSQHEARDIFVYVAGHTDPIPLSDVKISYMEEKVAEVADLAFGNHILRVLAPESVALPDHARPLAERLAVEALKGDTVARQALHDLLDEHGIPNNRPELPVIEDAIPDRPRSKCAPAGYHGQKASRAWRCPYLRNPWLWSGLIRYTLKRDYQRRVRHPDKPLRRSQRPRWWLPAIRRNVPFP